MVFMIFTKKLQNSILKYLKDKDKAVIWKFYALRLKFKLGTTALGFQDFITVPSSLNILPSTLRYELLDAISSKKGG